MALGDCSPVFLTTHGKPIQAGCGTTCETGGMKATARQTGQECTNVSADLARKMQPFLGYMCPVGWCGAEGCVLSGLTLECCVKIDISYCQREHLIFLLRLQEKCNSSWSTSALLAGAAQPELAT
ncbi:hypothetical protein MTO96_031612 [Rhipicephalus appendiculatus]